MGLWDIRTVQPRGDCDFRGAHDQASARWSLRPCVLAAAGCVRVAATVRMLLGRGNEGWRRRRRSRRRAAGRGGDSGARVGRRPADGPRFETCAQGLMSRRGQARPCPALTPTRAPRAASVLVESGSAAAASEHDPKRRPSTPRSNTRGSCCGDKRMPHRRCSARARLSTSSAGHFLDRRASPSRAGTLHPSGFCPRRERRHGATAREDITTSCPAPEPARVCPRGRYRLQRPRRAARFSPLAAAAAGPAD